MKKILLLATSLLLAFFVNAQVSKTVNISAGGLSATLTEEEKASVIELVVTGEIDARDFKCMRDEFLNLSILDISTVTIKPYNGKGGTGTGLYILNTTYLANVIPIGAFCTLSGSFDPIKYGKTSLKKVILPNHLLSIDKYAFYGCSGLTGNLIIPNSVKSIAEGAFGNCAGLNKKIVIGDSLNLISQNAFYMCTNITGLELGASMISIESGAFAYCSSLKIIKCHSIIPPTLSKECFKSAPISMVYVPPTTYQAYKTADGWKNYQITAEKRISINNVSAGNLATSIITSGYGPLSSITHLTVMGEFNAADFSQIRRNMTALNTVDITQVDLADDYLSDSAFMNKQLLESIRIPQSLKKIGNYAFYGCSGLSGELVIPSSVLSIGNSAFYGCSGFSGELIIPNTVTAIGNSAFMRCSGLSGELIIPSSVLSLGNYTFFGCGGFSGNLIIPNTVTEIGIAVFYGCSGLTGNLIIPNSVKSIAEGAFYGCSGFSGELIIPNTVTAIGNSAFMRCSGLSGELIIPELIKRIESSTFDGCLNITSLYIDKNVEVIDERAFNGCSNLKNISVARSNPPLIFATTFDGVDKTTCVLEVGESLPYQTADYWSQFSTVTIIFYDLILQISNGGKIKENNNILAKDTTLSLVSGSSLTLIFMPDSGYKVAKLIMNEEDVTSQIENDCYLIRKIDYNLTVSVSFYLANSSKNIKDNFLKVFTRESEIVIDGTIEGEKVFIYKADGVLLKQLQSKGNSISTYVKKGCYIVKTNSQSVKVIL